MQHVQDETSERLLEAAHRLLAEQGAGALTVRRIATEAGMSTMNVYSRFGGKDGVVDELYRTGFDRLFKLIEAVEDSGDPTADLMSMAQAYRRFGHEHPTYYGVMFRTAIHDFDPSPESVDFALNGLAVFMARVEDAQRVGAVTSDLGAGVIAASLWATCHGLVSLELSAVGAERIDWADVFDTAVATALRGLDSSTISTDGR